MTATIPGAMPKGKAGSGRLGKPATVLITLALILAGIQLLVLAGALGGTFYLDRQYSLALDAVKEGNYTQAAATLNAVPAFFKETTKLLEYAQAGEALEGGDYDSARDKFHQLGDFRDSRAMVHEADYRRAKVLLAKESYSDAAALLAQLTKAAYRDAAELLPEAQYGMAKDRMKTGDYEAAAELLQKLSAKKYKDASQLLLQANYSRAVELYRGGDYAKAQALLADMDGYENSDAYYLLTQLQLKQFKTTAYAARMTAVKKLLELGKEEDFVSLLTGDDWICYLLQGRWLNGSRDFVMTHDDDGFSINYTLPYVEGKYYVIEDSVLYVGSDDTGWNKCFEFKFESERAVVVHCFKDGSEYKLYRSPS